MRPAQAVLRGGTRHHRGDSGNRRRGLPGAGRSSGAIRRLQGDGLPHPSGREPYGRAAVAAPMPRTRREAVPPLRARDDSAARACRAVLLTPGMISTGKNRGRLPRQDRRFRRRLLAPDERGGPSLGYSHQGQEFSDHAAELRKHPQVDPGSRTFWVRGTSSVSAGHP